MILLQIHRAAYLFTYCVLGVLSDVFTLCGLSRVLFSSKMMNTHCTYAGISESEVLLYQGHAVYFKCSADGYHPHDVLSHSLAPPVQQLAAVDA
jgi:hypothetical protein